MARHLHTASVLAEVFAERRSQLEKWGEQNHPDHDARSQTHLPSATDARFYCDQHFTEGRGSWLDILLEEVCEAADEAVVGNVADLRKELIQVAAVAVAQIEAIDRRPVS